MKYVPLTVIFCLIFLGAFWYSSTQTQASIPPKKEVIYLVPIGHFPLHLAQTLEHEIEQFYAVSAIILPSVHFPKSTFISSQNRYQANKILSFLTSKYGNKQAKILALTNQDICTDRVLNGVMHRNYRIFGLGYMPGNACVISSSRFKKDVPRQLTLVALHELGHNYGLPHCQSNITCMMNDAKGTGKVLEHEKKWFCPDCNKKYLKNK
jgi:archaemetzincin